MSDPAAWSDVFLAHVHGAAGCEHEEAAHALLETTLPRLLKEARAAWPDVQLTDEDFVISLARRWTAGESLATFLAAIQAGDLYLASGCALGLPAAIATFQSAYLGHLPALVARLSLRADFVEELHQVLLEKLLVARDGLPPKIAEYAGRGTLLGWVRVTALRTALSMRRRRVEEPLPNGELTPAVLQAPDQDPELRFLKAHYCEEFQAAFQGALLQLTVEKRNLLRLHYVDGLNIEKLGALFRIHRATAARRIAAAHSEIFERVRDLMQDRLQLSPSEFDSLTDLVRSQLHVSFVRLLQEDPAT